MARASRSATEATTSAGRGNGTSTTGAVTLVLAAAAVQEVGAAFAVTLLTTLGSAGAVFIRFAIAGLILGIAVRPRIRGLSKRDWGTVLGLAVALTTMNLCFYQALSRIPLGIAVAIEVCGPLLLSVLLGRRVAAWLWASLAFAGVCGLAVASDHSGEATTAGFLWAGGAAVSWAAYIMSTSAAARTLPKLDALALATIIGAVVTTPAAMATVDFDAALHWRLLLIAILVAVMSSVAPYSLEMWSLRTLPPGTFAVLTCLSPVVATLAGWGVLGQHLHSIHYLAILLVTVASMGAVRTAHSPMPPFRATTRRRRLR